MSRAERLLDLMQLMRRYRYPVKGEELASQLGISLRTLYRDIKSLQAQGADIQGEAGLGYVLKSGFTLPPLMFSVEEIEALVFGIRWAAEKGDVELRASACNALAKITAVLPKELYHQAMQQHLLIGPSTFEKRPIDDELIALRKAIRLQRKMQVTYCDLKNNISERVIWPFALAFFDQVNVILAWCELRKEIRCFRVDRLNAFVLLNEKYPTHRQLLLKQWQEANNVVLTTDIYY